MQQEVLEKHPKANLRVYAIWFRMYGTDRRSAWPSDVLSDRRVVHRWDEPKALGLWYANALDKIRDRVAPDATGLDGPVPVLWDSYLVYGPDARWSSQPTGLVRWGRTILNTRETLRSEIARIAK